MPAPSLDANRHRSSASSDELAIEAHFVSDKDRFVKLHAVHRDRGASPAGALCRETASGEIHLCEQPSAKDVTIRVGIGRHRDHANERQGRWCSSLRFRRS